MGLLLARIFHRFFLCGLLQTAAESLPGGCAVGFELLIAFGVVWHDWQIIRFHTGERFRSGNGEAVGIDFRITSGIIFTPERVIYAPEEALAFIELAGTVFVRYDLLIIVGLDSVAGCEVKLCTLDAIEGEEFAHVTVGKNIGRTETHANFFRDAGGRLFVNDYHSKLSKEPVSAETDKVCEV